jgi:hypothetical protein
MGVHKVIGVPMEDALPPEGCNRVSAFLRALTNISKKGKVDVAGAMIEWRNYHAGARVKDSKAWSNERVKYVLDLRKSGKKWDEIANEIGTTKNAILGALMRQRGSVRV